MAGNTQDDVDRTLVASGSEAIRYHSYNNFKRIVARHPTTLPSVADFLEASDGDAGIASESAETDLAQTYLDRPPAAELIAATRPLYQAAPPSAYVSLAVTSAPSAVTREPLSRLATPEPLPGLSPAAFSHGPIVAPLPAPPLAPPLASIFAYHAVHLAAGQAVSVPMQQYQQPFGPLQAAVASQPVEAARFVEPPRFVDAPRPVEIPVSAQTPYPVPPAYVAPSQPLPQKRILPAAVPPVPPAVAAWHMLAGQSMPEPIPGSAPSRLGSVEDLFRMLARRNEYPAPVATQTVSAPARWPGAAVTQPSAAAIQPEPEAYLPFTPAQGRPLSRFAAGQHNPGQVRPMPNASAPRFASQLQPALRPEPTSGVGDLFRRI